MRRPFLLSCLLTLTLVPSWAHAQKRSIEYTVQPGDTCWAIAKKLYSDPWKYKKIMKGSSVCPDKISPGQKLLLPHPEDIAPEDPAAKIAARRGDVDARSPKIKDWSPAKKGQNLWRAWRVNSGERSSARVAFTQSGARLEMRENTLVVIYGPQNSKVRRTGGRAVLANGSLHARLAELAGEDLTVETPSAQAAMRDGEVIFEVDKSSTTTVSNHTSKKVTLEGVDAPKKKKKKRRKKRRRKKVVVAANMGSKVAPGKDPTPPRPLPAAPVFTSSKVKTSFGAGAAPISWAAVPGAATYRVELLSGPSPKGEILDVIPVKAPTTKVAFESLAKGTYYVRVSVRDSEGFEGRFSKDAELILEGKAPNQVKGVAGSMFPAPPDSKCRIGDGELSRETRIPGVGTHLVRCERDGTGALQEFQLVATAPTISNDNALSNVVLEEGDVTKLEIVFDDPVFGLWLDAPEGIRTHGSGHRDGGKKWLFFLSWDQESNLAGKNMKLKVGDDVVREVPIHVTGAQGGSLHPWSVGAYLGGGASWSESSPDPSYRVGLRLRGEVSSWLATRIEFEGGANTARVPELAGRIGVEAMLKWGSVKPFLRLGMGAEMLSSPKRQPHVFAAGGLGLMWEIQPRWTLRADIVQEAAVFDLEPNFPLRGMIGSSFSF